MVIAFVTMLKGNGTTIRRVGRLTGYQVGGTIDLADWLFPSPSPKRIFYEGKRQRLLLEGDGPST
jgi:hypothetical protein